MAKAYLSQVVDETGASHLIGVHVRRTDYGRWLRKNSNATLADEQLILNAMNFALDFTELNANGKKF